MAMAGAVVGLLSLASCDKDELFGDGCADFECKGEIITIVMEPSVFGGDSWSQVSKEVNGIDCMPKSNDDKVITDSFDMEGRYVVKFYNCQGSNYTIND